MWRGGPAAWHRASRTLRQWPPAEERRSTGIAPLLVDIVPPRWFFSAWLCKHLCHLYTGCNAQGENIARVGHRETGSGCCGQLPMAVHHHVLQSPSQLYSKDWAENVLHSRCFAFFPWLLKTECLFKTKINIPSFFLSPGLRGIPCTCIFKLMFACFTTE